MRSSNPVLNDKAFTGLGESAGRMTINGTVTRTLILLLLLVASALFTWDKVRAGDLAAAMPWALGGLIGGLIFCLITCFAKPAAPFTAPVYAICEGLFLGAISAVMETKFKGIVLDAVLLTGGTLFGLLVAYRTGLIKATENFKLGVFAATAGIALVYLVSFVMGLFGKNIPYIHESGWVGIGFSLFVVVIAALNLVLDFDFIEQGEAAGAPKYMEWYAAFGLMVTLIWLYIEFLRLLAKLRR
ncbi:MAG: Bax inhibitor-1/YccA family protein [Verrucomicrobia bacterium]|nr:Bax inhibitor-1/YccA family protein [Verrucomicrobiota bacterium]